MRITTECGISTEVPDLRGQALARAVQRRTETLINLYGGAEVHLRATLKHDAGPLLSQRPLDEPCGCHTWARVRPFDLRQELDPALLKQVRAALRSRYPHGVYRSQPLPAPAATSEGHVTAVVMPFGPDGYPQLHWRVWAAPGPGEPNTSGLWFGPVPTARLAVQQSLVRLHALGGNEAIQLAFDLHQGGAGVTEAITAAADALN